MKRYDVRGKNPAELFISMLQDGTREWREELGKVPRAAMTWRPYKDGYSIGALILHIVDVEAYWIEVFAAGKKLSEDEEKELMSNETDQYRGKWPIPHDWPLSKYFALQDRVRERSIKTIRKLKPDLVLKRSSGGQKYEVTLNWILHHVVTHEAYHGGQAVLLKALRAKTASKA